MSLPVAWLINLAVISLSTVLKSINGSGIVYEFIPLYMRT